MCIHVTVCVSECMCVRVCVLPALPGCRFSADPINPPIFRPFSSLWLLQTFGRHLCCGVESHPKKNLCSSRVPLRRQTFPNLQPGHVNLCVRVCALVHVTLVIDGSLVTPQGDHRQLNSIQSPCRLFLPSFTFKGQNPPRYGTLSVTFNATVTVIFHPVFSSSKLFSLSSV